VFGLCAVKAGSEFLAGGHQVSGIARDQEKAAKPEAVVSHADTTKLANVTPLLASQDAIMNK
jgi:putative NADH-flavin reductase